MTGMCRQADRMGWKWSQNLLPPGEKFKYSTSYTCFVLTRPDEECLTRESLSNYPNYRVCPIKVITQRER